ncbi:SPOR domain-containing protein [Jannaschia sp. LMIT008]|uniref:SPOR domain-containing protein n=1 Tax=Jannaschia maritima TaxID=3032585 RepID=UPI002810C2A1|nr:SPOR domain-containing protein [Jannaschia sp. LMIT008]
MDYFGSDYGAEDGARMGDALRGFGWTNWLGALTSVGLMAGAAWWAVDLTMRDVSAVPIIRAMEGPMRIAPEDPGGQAAPFQGLALADITAGGAAAPAPDAIRLAPTVATIDAPTLGERLAQAEAAEAEAAKAAAIVPKAPVNDRVAALGGSTATPGLVLSEAVEAGPSAILPEDIDDAVAAALAEAGLTPQTDATPVTATLPTSVRPERRPARPVRVAAASHTRDVDPATLPADSRMVQLGAFDSEDVARGEWTRIQGRYGDYLHGTARVVQRATSGDAVFWRLRAAGLSDGDAARRLCTALMAQGQPCIVVARN